MRLALLALALAGCGNMTEETTPIGACAEPTREWWPAKTDARWVYRITDRLSITTNPVGGVLPPDVAWKEQVITGVDVAIGGLAGDERGIRMRTIDPLDAQWDFSHFLERDNSYRWASKLIYPELAFPPDFPLDEDKLAQERVYTSHKTRLNYSADHLCVGKQWHEEWTQFRNVIGDPPLSEESGPRCSLSAWTEDPWACEPSTEREGSNWRVAAVDATVALFNDRVFYEHALCLRRLDDNFQNDTLYCWVRDVGKVLECEVDHFSREVTKVEELCLFCPPGEDCEWRTEDRNPDRTAPPPPPLCHDLCMPCPEGEDCEWTEGDESPPPDCALTGNWEARTCEDALIY